MCRKLLLLHNQGYPHIRVYSGPEQIMDNKTLNNASNSMKNNTKSTVVFGTPPILTTPAASIIHESASLFGRKARPMVGFQVQLQLQLLAF
jgi:hypothetical protein